MLKFAVFLGGCVIWASFWIAAASYWKQSVAAQKEKRTQDSSRALWLSIASWMAVVGSMAATVIITKAM
jgi:hypothetical protein